MPTFDRSKPILVFLASGVQGAAVLRAGARHGYRMRALVRDPARAPGLDGRQIQIAQGDLDDHASLVDAGAGCAHAVLQVPTGEGDTMIRRAEAALSAFRSAGIRSFILRLASASRPAPCEEPSLSANHEIEQAARRAGLPFAVVRPTLYLDNLLKPSARADLLRRGVFAPPIRAAQAIAWTSADDCAAAALHLLAHGAMGGDHRIAGAESLDGTALTDRIGQALGRTIRYEAQSVDAFETEVERALGSGAGRRIASKFRYFESHPSEAEAILARPYRAHPALDGFEPTGVAEWVRQNRHRFTDPGDDV